MKQTTLFTDEWRGSVFWLQETDDA